MGKDVIIACDFASRQEVETFLDRFEGKKPFVKIGMELFYAEGPDIVREIKRRGHKIFLDLKLHDIPNTVKKSMRVLSNLDVDLCNLHAAGTVRMMEAAIEGLTRPDGTRPLLIAVTQLTSTDQESLENDLLIHEPIDQVVMHYARNAKKAGLDVAMLVWSIMCVELCASLFSIPSIILTVLASFNTKEEAAHKLKIAKALNIVGMVCFATFFAFFIAMIAIAYWTSL